MADPAVAELTDSELVARSAAGDREAFGRIVARYQTLVCSLAYNRTGDLAHSEDLAQETFLAAWRRLARLREPERLRSWLCGIARNLIHNSRRRLAREPAHAGEALEDLGPIAATDPLPSEEAITREREAILWRALERVPETYREPLILYYREQRSVERVAAELDLSEEAVRQRLSRGRRFLHRQVIAFVEGALERTAPGETFTMAVVGALPLLAAPSVATAAASLPAAKGGAAALGSKLAGAAFALIGPVLSLLWAWIGVKSSLDATRTPRERAEVWRLVRRLGAAALVFTLFAAVLVPAVRAGIDARIVGLAAAGFMAAYVLYVVGSAYQHARELARVRAEERRQRPEAFREAPLGPLGPPIIYRTRLRLLGLPLVDVRLSTPPGERVRPAIGWVAIGDRAIGALFAFGGLAVGTVSLGGLSLGLLSVGGFGLGVVAVGGIAAGILASGGMALGWIATGGVALGWLAADGGVALAGQLALGWSAAAPHANDALAKEFFARRSWLDIGTLEGRLFGSLLWLPMLLLLVPRYAAKWRRRRGA